jgi:hypothetical protein
MKYTVLVGTVILFLIFQVMLAMVLSVMVNADNYFVVQYNEDSAT